MVSIRPFLVETEVEKNFIQSACIGNKSGLAHAFYIAKSISAKIKSTTLGAPKNLLRLSRNPVARLKLYNLIMHVSDETVSTYGRQRIFRKNR